jgi:hypothetical protein
MKPVKSETKATTTVDTMWTPRFEKQKGRLRGPL